MLFLRKFTAYFVFIVIFNSFTHTTIAARSTKNVYRVDELIREDKKTILSALFVPDDNIRNLLVELINREQKYIYVSQYRITDKAVTLALKEAYLRNVIVDIVVDQGLLNDNYEKASLLARSGIPIRVNPKPYRLMHNKYLIFGDIFFNNRLKNNRIVWTGSANATKAGLGSNEENVLISNDPEIVERFIKQFTILKQKTIPLVDFSERFRLSQEVLRQYTVSYLDSTLKLFSKLRIVP